MTNRLEEATEAILANLTPKEREILQQRFGGKATIVMEPFDSPEEKRLYFDEKAEREHPGAVNHPGHYGGKDHPFEARLLIRDWGLGFNLGNLLKYLYRFRFKGGLQDLRKAEFYLNDAQENITQLIFASTHELDVEEFFHYRADTKTGQPLTHQEKAIFRGLWLMPEKANKYSNAEDTRSHLLGLRMSLIELIKIVEHEHYATRDR